jgi:hypothetical protein
LSSEKVFEAAMAFSESSSGLTIADRKLVYWQLVFAKPGWSINPGGRIQPGGKSHISPYDILWLKREGHLFGLLR